MDRIASATGRRVEALLQSLNRQQRDLSQRERALEKAWDNWDWESLWADFEVVKESDYKFTQKFLSEYGDTGWETKGRSARGRRAKAPKSPSSRYNWEGEECPFCQFGTVEVYKDLTGKRWISCLGECGVTMSPTEWNKEAERMKGRSAKGRSARGRRDHLVVGEEAKFSQRKLDQMWPGNHYRGRKPRKK